MARNPLLLILGFFAAQTLIGAVGTTHPDARPNLRGVMLIAVRFLVGLAAGLAIRLIQPSFRH